MTMVDANDHFLLLALQILDQNCIKSWSTPFSVVFNGPARLLTKQNDNSLDRYIYVAVASGPDITSKEEGRVVWFWKDCDDSVPVDSAKEAGLKKTTRMVRVDIYENGEGDALYIEKIVSFQTV